MPAHPLFVILFFIVWSAVMGSFLYFTWHVAPTALRDWAEEQGLQVIRRRHAGPLAWHSFAKGSGHLVYRVQILDSAGQTWSGLVRVGTAYYPCLSPSRCPVEVRWDRSEEGPRRPVRPVSRRTVLGFAAADFLLSALVMALVLVLLVVVGVCLDEMGHGGLGLNRRLGRVPRPDASRETHLVLGMCLGLLVLYLPALVALTAGAVGLMGRKWWGYWAHLIGSALVAFTGFGIVYTIPSLAMALRPEFREFFRDTRKTRLASDPLGDASHLDDGRRMGWEIPPKRLGESSWLWDREIDG
jgi:hypothetical protein